MIKYLKHSIDRKQQRCINDLELLFLLEYGSEEQQSGGDTYHYCSQKNMKKLLRDLKRLDMNRLLNIFAVSVGDGRLKTVGHQTRHHKRK